MDSLLFTAIEAARAASREILAVYTGSFDIELKDDHSPVTIADKRSNAIILQHLEKTGIPVLSEESENLPYSERKEWEQYWIVDPLDGTRQFIRRNDEFTVNISLATKEDGPVLGVLYLPVERKLYYSERNKGAWMVEDLGEKNESEIKSHSIRLPHFAENKLKVAVNRSSSGSSEMNAFLHDLEKERGLKPELVVAGSALKFGWLAEGKASYYPRFKPSMEWDTAAGHAIVKETGFTVINAETGEELKYNKPSLLNPSFIVLKQGIRGN